jgi:hypothetical protein
MVSYDVLLISYDFVWFLMNWEATFGRPRGRPSFVTKVPPPVHQSHARSHARVMRGLSFGSFPAADFFEKNPSRHTPKERYPGAVLE